jgi:hypothetical protein
VLHSGERRFDLGERRSRSVSHYRVDLDLGGGAERSTAGESADLLAAEQLLFAQHAREERQALGCEHVGRLLVHLVLLVEGARGRPSRMRRDEFCVRESG